MLSLLRATHEESALAEKYLPVSKRCLVQTVNPGILYKHY